MKTTTSGRIRTRFEVVFIISDLIS